MLNGTSTQPIAESVVVITGASSGIGLQTALTFAGEGASLVPDEARLR